MEFTREEKLSLMKSLMWDYDIPPEHCPEVLEGTRDKAGHYKLQHNYFCNLPFTGEIAINPEDPDNPEFPGIFQKL